MVLTTLVIPSVVTILLVQVGKELLGKISARWGALVVQIVLLAVSFVIAGVAGFLNLLPQHIVDGTIQIFATSMVYYEVFYKALYKDTIRGGKTTENAI